MAWRLLSAVFDNTQQRLMRFFVNTSLKPYLKKSLQAEEFEVGLAKGQVMLKDLILDEAVCFIWSRSNDC